MMRRLMECDAKQVELQAASNRQERRRHKDWYRQHRGKVMFALFASIVFTTSNYRILSLVTWRKFFHGTNRTSIYRQKFDGLSTFVFVWMVMSTRNGVNRLGIMKILILCYFYGDSPIGKYGRRCKCACLYLLNRHPPRK